MHLSLSCPSSRRWLLLCLAVGGLSVGTGTLVGCSGDTLNGPPRSVDAAHAYWALQIQQPHAITLALTPPYNTVRLTAIPRNPNGQPLTGLGTVQYTAAGDSSVLVDSTGLVTARKVTGQTTVVATLLDVQQHVTLADTVYIQVTATVPRLPLTLSVQPVAGDSAVRPLQQTNNLFLWGVTVVDSAARDTLCQVTDGPCGALLMQIVSSNPAIVRQQTYDLTRTPVENQRLEIQRNNCCAWIQYTLGSAYLTATALAYGTVLRDSVLLKIKPGSQYQVSLLMTTSDNVVYTPVGFDVPRSLTLGAGAVVQWNVYASGNTTPFDVKFDQPAAADTASCSLDSSFAGILPLAFPPTGSRDVAPFGNDTTGFQPGSVFQVVFPDTGGYIVDPTWFANNCRARRFSTPGVYHWHSSLFPADTFSLTIVP